MRRYDNLASMLNRRVELWGYSDAPNELDELDQVPVKIKDMWVSIIPQTGSMQKAQADTLLSEVTTKFICRYGTGKSITTDMWLVYNGNRHDIVYLIDPYAKHETWEIFCKEVISGERIYY